MLTAFLALVVGVVGGVLLHRAWMIRDETGQAAFWEMRRRRRRDRVRETIALAQENLYAENAERALGFARRAVRLDRCNAQSHAVLAACLDHVQHYEQGLVHHRRAQHLDTYIGQKDSWRLQNALDAVQACMQLRGEAAEAEAQALWDEAAAWARLAYLIDPNETQEVLAMDPWLIPFAPGGQEWLRA